MGQLNNGTIGHRDKRTTRKHENRTMGLQKTGLIGKCDYGITVTTEKKENRTMGLQKNRTTR